MNVQAHQEIRPWRDHRMNHAGASLEGLQSPSFFFTGLACMGIPPTKLILNDTKREINEIV